MPSSDDTRRQSAERARALLAVLDIQPPPDFEARVLARVYALQARRASHPTPYARPLPSQRPSRGWRRVCWHIRPRSWFPGSKAVACGLVVASAVLLWCVSTRVLPAVWPEGERQASAALQHDAVPTVDYLDGAGRSAAAFQEMVAAAEPVPQPSTLAHQSREVQRGEGEHAVRPEAPLVPGLPVWSREAPQLSSQAHEQRSGRQRGVRSKTKRSGKGLRLSRHMPA
jgi:hypothetical protein